MAIGIDIGHRSIKVAILEGSARSPKVTSFIQRRIPFSDDPVKHYKSQVETLQALLKELVIKGHSLLANVDLSKVMVRQFSMPFTQEDQIAKTVSFEAESYLHGHSLENIILDYKITKKLEQSSEILVVAATKKEIRQRIQLCNDSGFDPSMLGLDAYSFMETLRFAGMLEGDQSTLFADLGARYCRLLLVQGGQIRVLRAAPSGFFNEIMTLVTEQGCMLEEAENRFFGKVDVWSDSSGEVPGEAPVDPNVEDAKSKYMQKIIREVNRTLLKSNTSDPVEKMVLSGGGSFVPGILEKFSRELGFDVQRLDLSSAFTGAGTGESFSSLASVAVGTTLMGMQSDWQYVNFRQDELAYEKKLDAIRNPLLIAMTLLLILFGFFAILQEKKLNWVMRENKAIEEKEKEIWEKTFPGGEEFPGVEKIKAKMERQKTQLLEFLGEVQGEKLKKKSCLEVLAEVVVRIDRDEFKGKYKIESLNFSSTSGKGVYKLVMDISSRMDANTMAGKINDSGLLSCETPKINATKNNATFRITLE